MPIRHSGKDIAWPSIQEFGVQGRVKAQYINLEISNVSGVEKHTIKCEMFQDSVFQPFFMSLVT